MIEGEENGDTCLFKGLLMNLLDVLPLSLSLTSTTHSQSQAGTEPLEQHTMSDHVLVYCNVNTRRQPTTAVASDSPTPMALRQLWDSCFRIAHFVVNLLMMMMKMVHCRPSSHPDHAAEVR